MMRYEISKLNLERIEPHQSLLIIGIARDKEKVIDQLSFLRHDTVITTPPTAYEWSSFLDMRNGRKEAQWMSVYWKHVSASSLRSSVARKIATCGRFFKLRLVLNVENDQDVPPSIQNNIDFSCFGRILRINKIGFINATVLNVLPIKRIFKPSGKKLSTIRANVWS